MKNKNFNIEDAKEIVKAWEKLEGNKRYSPKEIGSWLLNDMAPVINKLREKIKINQ